jgi:hypothetical protein
MVCAPWCSSESWPLRVSMTDSIHWRMGPSEPCRRGSSLRSGPQQPAAEVGDELLEVAAGEALVGDDRGAVELDAAQDLGGGVALGQVGREQVERDRHAVGRAQQHQPEAPEVAAVAAAVAVGRVAGKVRAPDGLARGSAWHRGGVQQPEGVAPRRRAAREDAEHERDLRRARARACCNPAAWADTGTDARAAGARSARTDAPTRSPARPARPPGRPVPRR